MDKKRGKSYILTCPMKGDLGEIRTLDPLIKSQLLYQLSYEVVLLALFTLFFRKSTEKMIRRYGQ